MSDHGHHDPGGHELEAVNTNALFKLMSALSLITLLASLAVVQWFYSQRRALEAEHNAAGSFQLKQYDAKMTEQLEGVDRVALDIVSNPALLAAPAPPPGWVHPDDLVGAATAAPTESAHAEAPPEPSAPGKDDHAVVGEGEGDAPPAEGDAPAEADAPATPDDDAQPAAGGGADKPAKPAQDQAKPDQPKPDQAKPDQAKPDQATPDNG